ncbi:hypothetical protein SPFL3101_02819 [Sporomusaceae bacterium FL31]|nr:hypothetical protein SPFL3101_02819 [Sporomusaceae bacterium FL31]
MSSLEDTFISRQRQRFLQCQQRLRFLLVLLEAGEQEIDIGVFEVIGGLLHFVLMEHVAVGGNAQRAVAPHQIVNAVHALDVHRQTFQTVSDLAGDRFALHTANLLEVGKLRDFHAV